MKITYAVATSLDGYLARDDGDVSWLDELNIDMQEAGLEEFMASVDGLLMGRGTYDFVFNYGSWPYGEKPTWVFTRQSLEPLNGANLSVVDEIKSAMDDANSLGLKHLWLIGGGKLASSFLDEGLITDLSISEMPVILGSGIPLFASHELDQIESEHKTVTERKGFRQIDIAVGK